MRTVTPSIGGRYARQAALRSRICLLLGAFLAIVVAAVAPKEAAAQITDCAQLTFEEVLSTLPDGTPYGMRRPPNWNGVLINDLDYVGARNGARSCYWLGQGYALSGTNRHPLRTFQYDPAQEIRNLLTVLDLFEARFSKPTRVLQYGHSGGGFVGLNLAELHPDRVDGVIAGCAHEQVPLMNMMLDGWFVLKALLAPDLQITDFTDVAAIPGLAAKWREVISAAQQTAEGRARIALAVTIGQWPAWSSATNPQPDPRDVHSLQQAMFETVLANAGQPGGQSRFMSEHAGGVPLPRQLSWNTDINYRKFFSNGDDDYKRAVRRLYRDAGLDVESDLALVNAFSRISADPGATAFWLQSGRAVHGTPKVPILRMHTSGDNVVPPAITEGYLQKMRANDSDDRLYRSALVDRAGHCTFSVGESAAAVETLMRRLDTDRWPRTSPKRLNELASSLVPTSTSLFIEYDPDRFNRPENSPPSRRPRVGADDHNR